MWSVAVLIVMLSVVMVNVVMLSVAAPPILLSIESFNLFQILICQAQGKYCRVQPLLLSQATIAVPYR